MVPALRRLAAATLRDRDRGDAEFVFSAEDRPLGTGGAVAKALPMVRSDPFLVVNGDSFCRVSYAELLQAFWRIHNPTTRNRQGFDFGSQYRSAIFYHDPGQMEAAIASRDAKQRSLRRPIVTQITPASAFYRAEEYHQRYLEKHGHPSCAATIR